MLLKKNAAALVFCTAALSAEKQNVLDDGRVIGHVSAADVNLVEKVDHIHIEDK